jgi:hypothetical protein
LQVGSNTTLFFIKQVGHIINFVFYRYPRSRVVDMNIRNEERNPEGFNKELDRVCSLADKCGILCRRTNSDILQSQKTYENSYVLRKHKKKDLGIIRDVQLT